MSRVSYVMMNPGGDDELTSTVRRALDELLGELVDAAGVDARLGARGRGRRQPDHAPPRARHRPHPARAQRRSCSRPTVPSTGRPPSSGSTCRSRRSTPVPCIAGHVGADTAAAVLAEGPHRGERVQLLVDVGTNAEIVLGDARRQYAASSPTGPAFEGAQISCGQRATAGAIERVRIDPVTLEPRLQVIGVRRVERRARVRRRRGGHRRHRRVRVGHHRRRRRAVPRRRDRPRRHDRRRQRRAQHPSRPRRAHLRYVLYGEGDERAVDHPERRARRATGEGRAAGRHRPAARARRRSTGRRRAPGRARSARTSTRCTRWCSG